MQLGASQTLAYSWKPFPSTGCLTSFDVRFVPGLIVSCCAVFSWCPWERGGMGELTEAEGRLCVQDISYKRKIKKLKRRLTPAHVLWTYLRFCVSELTL